jgi:hypothetical protein
MRVGRCHLLLDRKPRSRDDDHRLSLLQRVGVPDEAADERYSLTMKDDGQLKSHWTSLSSIHDDKRKTRNVGHWKTSGCRSRVLDGLPPARVYTAWCKEISNSRIFLTLRLDLGAQPHAPIRHSLAIPRLRNFVPGDSAVQKLIELNPCILEIVHLFLEQLSVFRTGFKELESLFGRAEIFEMTFPDQSVPVADWR